MSYQFDETLFLGNEEIDRHHGAIFEQYDRLTDAVQREDMALIREELAKIISSCSGEHVATEERLMEEYAYPQIDSHRQAHRDLDRVISSLTDRIDHDGCTVEIAKEAVEFLFRYVVGHINTFDLELASYISYVIGTMTTLNKFSR